MSISRVKAPTPMAPPRVIPPSAGEPPRVLPPLPIFPERTQSKVDPYALAGKVFTTFQTNFAAMLQGETVPDLTLCRSVLDRALGDAALLNITARLHFERLVAQLLAGGWQRGHEILLVAATRAFDWDRDRRRLMEFGDDGACLSRAIDERNMFDAQPNGEMQAQGEVIARLRVDTPPTTSELVRGMAHLNALASRFPTWMALVTDVSKIVLWRKLDLQIPRWRRALMFERKPKPLSGGPSRSFGWGTWITILIIINVLRLGFQSDAAPPSGPQTPAETRPTQLRSVKPSEARVAAILARLVYPVPAALRKELQVEYEIELDDIGKARKVTVIGPSRDPGYDAAMAAAIRAAPPFEMALPRHFSWYHIRPRLAPLPSMQFAGPSDAQMRAISDRVVYRPPPSLKGGLRVEHAVELNEIGRVIKVETVLPSRDPAFDRAVAAAIGAARPFPATTRRRFKLTNLRTHTHSPPGAGEFKKARTPFEPPLVPPIVLPQAAAEPPAWPPAHQVSSGE